MISIFWHRRDLRIHDNAALFKALKNSGQVQPIFVFDETILSKLPRDDQRVVFIHQEIERLKEEYKKFGCDLQVFYGNPITLIPEIAGKLNATSVYTNRDYEPYALERDQTIFEVLHAKNIAFIGAKDHVIFEKSEILKGDGTPYTIFTPYSRKWKEKLNELDLSSYEVEIKVENLMQTNASKLISLAEMGFENKRKIEFPARIFPEKIIQSYSETRDIPSILGTSRLSLHLRFGTISVRELARMAVKNNETYLNELIWRDFSLPAFCKVSFSIQIR
ncbi:MAG: hypothetical protein RL265_626 [Bacteroidota bacterium]